MSHKHRGKTVPKRFQKCCNEVEMQQNKGMLDIEDNNQEAALPT